VAQGKKKAQDETLESVFLVKTEDEVETVSLQA